MSKVNSICVYCGSSSRVGDGYKQAAHALGTLIGESGRQLVYGGGRVGLMGVLADAALAGGGAVLGIIPEFLQRREVAHGGAVELVMTDTMHDRKRRMFEAADAFVTLPGGLGTFDETIEITTWRQLGLHDKPVLVCNVAGWAQPFLAMMRAAVDQGFAEPSSAQLFEVLPDVGSVLARLSEVARPGIGQPERV